MARRDVNVQVSLRDRARTGFRHLRDAVSSVLKPLSLLTAAGTAIGTIFGVRFLSGAIRSSGEFAEAMSAVGAVTGATAEDLEKLEQAADEAGATTRFTATEAANGLEELARAGQTSQQAIATLNPVLQLAAANNQTVAESAIQVTTALNAFGLSADQAGRVSDVYTRAAQRSAQTTQQLAGAMGQVAPVAAQAGLSVEETSALIGRLADAGFRGERGGTALRNALSQLQDPTSKFRRELAAAGITSTNFIEVIEQLAAGGAQAETAIRALGLEAAPAIQSLVAGGASALRELTAELENAKGASEDAAAAMSDNLPGAIREFRSAWDGLQRTLVAPLVDRITDQIQALTVKLREFASSGLVEQVQQLLVNAFDAAVASITEFLGRIDFSTIGQQIADFARIAGDRLRKFATDADETIRAVDRFVATLQIFGNGLALAFNGIATAIGATLSFINRQVTRQLEAIQRFQLGLNPIVNKAVNEVKALQDDLDRATTDFAVRSAESLAGIQTAWERLQSASEESATAQSRAVENLGETAEATGEKFAGAAFDVEQWRAEMDKGRAVFESWDRAAARAGESVERTTKQTTQLGDQAEATGEKVDQLGQTSAETGDELEAAAGRSLTAWLDFGNGLEQVTFAVQELSGTAPTLQALQIEAEAAMPPFQRLEQAIAAAVDTTGLNNIIVTMGQLQQQGLITEGQYQQLTATVLEHARALEISAAATQQQKQEMADLGGQALQTAGALDQVGNAARGASQQAKSSAQGFGAILDSWRGINDEIDARIDRFVEGLNSTPILTFSSASRRLALFTRALRDRYGDLADAARESNEEVERSARISVPSGPSSRGSTRSAVDINLNVNRDPQGPLVLSEADLQRIVESVLRIIQRDGETTT